MFLEIKEKKKVKDFNKFYFIDFLIVCEYGVFMFINIVYVNF